jgi:signal transduction histidine kinase/ligand-binding sensor domain-containing protein
MITFKKCFIVSMIGVAIGVVSSCDNNSKDVQPPSGKMEFKQPTILPLKFGKAKKIDWAGIKSVKIQPVIQKLDLGKLPAQNYNGSDSKSVKYTVEEAKFDYNTLPQKDFNINKLPSKPLKFKTFILPPPKLIKSGPPHLKNVNNISLFELGEIQGLHGNIITNLFIDRDDFLWIGTDRGVYRYDGENLLLYLSNSGNPRFFGIIQDKLGRIWVSEYGAGINILDINNGILLKAGPSEGLSSNRAVWMTEDDEQRIWVALFPGGVNIIDPNTQTVKSLGKTQGLSDTTGTVGVTKDKDNNVWISTSIGGLDMIDLKNNKIKYFDKAHGLKSDSLSSILYDRESQVLVSEPGGIIDVLNLQKSTIQSVNIKHPREVMSGLRKDKKGRISVSSFNNGITIIDPKEHIATNMRTGDGLNSDVVYNATPDKQGRLWVATVKGLNAIDGDEFINSQIGETNTTALAEDKKGLIWQATFSDGINIIDRKTGISRNLSTKQGLTNDSVQTVKETNGNIFILSNSGLDIIDSARSTIAHLNKKLGLNNIMPKGIAADKKGLIWIAGDNGLDVYDSNDKSLKHIDPAKYLNDNIINDMVSDQQGLIWISTRSGGIDVIDPDNWTIRYLNNEQGLKDKAIKVLMPDSEGNMWIGSQRGIYIADLKNSTLTLFSDRQGLINNKINGLLQYKNRVYASTDKGITVITPPSKEANGKKWEAESFGRAYGITKSNSSYYETDMITRDGLYCWGDAGITILDLTKKDTLVTDVHIAGMNIMDQPSYFVNQSGSKNISAANAGYTIRNDLNWDNVTGPDNMPVNLQLPYNRNFIQFHYSNLNLLTRDTSWYRYILIGADRKWSDITSATSTGNYINLQPGKYTFEVISRSRNGLWSKPAQLSFTIFPPWWQTWWAYIIYVCLLGGSIWAFSHYRSLQLIKDKRLLEHKVHIRTEEVQQRKEEIAAQRDSIEQALDDLKHTQNQLIQSEKMASLGELTAGIAHEIQNPLNFINNFADVNTELIIELQDLLKDGNIDEALAISDDIKQNEEKINHHGKRADSIVKGMLQHSRASSNLKEPTDINKLVDEYLRLSYHGLRAKDKSFNAGMATMFGDSLPKLNIVQQDVGRVMLNLFNNAFYAVQQKQKIAGADYKPMVEVISSVHNGFVEIKVHDNGTGIPDSIKDKIMQPFFTTKPTGEGTGLGLSLSYDIVVKGHGGKVDVNTKEGEYTEFTIALPLSKV